MSQYSGSVIIDTGVAQESNAHYINESQAHQRDGFPSPSIGGVTTYHQGGGWNDTLMAVNGYPGGFPSGGAQPSIQDYNFVLNDDNYFGGTTNPIITGLSPVTTTTINSGGPNSTASGYFFYSPTNTGGPTATLAFQDWIAPGSYTISVTQGNNTLTSSLGKPSGIVTIYAQAGGGGTSGSNGQVVLATLTAGSSNATITSSFTSSAVFGQRPWQLYVTQVNMGGDYSALGWSSGFFYDAVGASGPTADPRDGDYSAKPPGNAFSSGVSTGCPPQGLSWDMNNSLNDTWVEGMQNMDTALIYVDGSDVGTHNPYLAEGFLVLSAVSEYIFTWAQYIPNLSAWLTPIPGTIVYPNLPTSSGFNPPYNGTTPFIDCGGIDSPTGWGDTSGSYLLPTGWGWGTGPAFTWGISCTRTGP